MSSESAFPADFNVGAFFSAVPANLKRTATNGESHLKILGAQAKSLQSYLGKAFSLQLTYAQALEAAARSYGFSDYNQARAALLQVPANAARGARVLEFVTAPKAGAEDDSDDWADQSDVCRDGGFVMSRRDLLEHLLRTIPSAVITGVNLAPEPEPDGWYIGRSSNFSKRAFNGKKHFALWIDPFDKKGHDWVPRLIERAQRLADAGLRSYLLLDKQYISDEQLYGLLSVRRDFIPIIVGYNFACSGEEGVPFSLWSQSAYDIFLTETESTSVLLELRECASLALDATQEAALHLLTNIPRDKYLRIPPPVMASSQASQL